MRRWQKILLLSIIIGAVPARLCGQAVDTVFVGTEHSPWTSGIVEFFVPTAGFAYAGDWKRGLLPNALRIGSAIAFEVTYDEGTDSCEDACTVWALTAFGTTVWSIVGAVQTANDYNEAIHEATSGLLLEPSPRGGLSLGLRIVR